MQALLVSIRAQLGVGYGGLQWKSVLTNEYLIEVDNNATDLKKVPRSWIKVNSTKAKVRYHTPEVIDGWMQLTRARELLEEEAERSWRAFLRRFSDSYALFRHIINALSELDCLLSLATTSLTAGYARPTFTADKRTLEMDDFRHPMTEQLISGAYVPNSVHLEEAGEELLIITGPNMGGKVPSRHPSPHQLLARQPACTSAVLPRAPTDTLPVLCYVFSVLVHPRHSSDHRHGSARLLRGRLPLPPVCVRWHPHSHGRARLSAHGEEHLPGGAGRDAADAGGGHSEEPAGIRRAGERHLDG